MQRLHLQVISGAVGMLTSDFTLSLLMIYSTEDHDNKITNPAKVTDKVNRVGYKFLHSPKPILIILFRSHLKLLASHEYLAQHTKVELVKSEMVEDRLEEVDLGIVYLVARTGRTRVD